MLSVLILFCSLAFDESPDLLRQIELDQRGFSCNTIDGVPGPKTERAAAFARQYGRAETRAPFRVETVTQADIDALVKIPPDPADRHYAMVRSGTKVIVEP